MADLVLSNMPAFKLAEKYRGLVVPIAAAGLFFVLLVPLPTWLMDILLVANIAFATLVFMTVIYITNPLDLAVFPSMLLSLTLFRLVLNTATTRLILTNGDEGTEAAGHVVQQFGQFVAGGSLAVGIIIFIIIVVLQFVVITKGATRIAEVAARFTLDGLPGKQMAIDADLNAGIIDDKEAKQRRDEISQEADFYGAMDGASKFVRGDAVAGIIITFVNILGGLYVGMVELGRDVWWCLETFTKLTIGDGLASQVPAFIVSVAAGMLVTRSTAKTNLGDELLRQLTIRPVALYLAAGFLLMLSVTKLPTMPLMLMSAGFAGTAFVLMRTRAETAQAVAIKEKTDLKKQPEKPEQFLSVDAMELEVGYGLIRLVDRKQSGDLLDRIANMRKQIAMDLGVVVPPIRIRDNVQLEPNQYVIKLRGLPIGRGETLPGHLLAIDSGTVSEQITGIDTKEPAFGLPAIWIEPDRKHLAEHRGYTVVEASGVLATHLTETIKSHASELLTRQEVNRLLDVLREKAPKLVEEVVPDILKAGDVQKVLQNLLRERVPIRDLETILETLGDWAPRSKDPDILTEYARNALARTICYQYRSDDNRIDCITLDPKVEEIITGHLERSDRGTFLTLSPTVQNHIAAAVREQLEQATPKCRGRSPIVLCSPQVRMWLRRLIESSLAHVGVLAFNEIVRGIEVESHGMVVIRDESKNV